MLGNTRGTLERNILEPMRSWWPGQVGIIRSDNTVEMFGKKVYALGADNKKHVARIQGATFEYVYGDEVTTWSQDVFEMLKSRLRCEHSHFDGTCNPDNPEHWFKKFLDSDADIYQQSYVIDDGVLPPKVVEELKKEYSGTVYYDRYILGLWCQADGLIYKFDNDNIVDVAPDSGEYYISCDYGTLNPFSAGLWCWNGKTATRIREYYYSGRDNRSNKTDEEYYTELERLAGDFPIKAVIVDPSAASFIEVIRRHKRFLVRKAINDVVPGIVTTSRYIQDGTVKVHRSCKDAIREFGLYRWDDKATEDKPIKENDHCLTGDTMVETVSGPVRIDRLVGKSGHVYCTDGKQAKIGYFHSVRMTQNNAEVFEIELKNGKTVKATADHPFLTKRGWVLLKDLRSDDQIACIGGTYGNDKIQRKQNSCIFRWLQIPKRLKNRIFSFIQKDRPE